MPKNKITTTLSEIDKFFDKKDASSAMFNIMRTINSLRLSEKVLFGRVSKCNQVYSLLRIYAHGLKDENIVFTSYEATGVVPSDNIPEYIKRNIAGASVVLAMVSKNYKASEVCMNEVGAAWAEIEYKNNKFAYNLLIRIENRQLN